ncbi:5-formyltetrahydrofolate cyclo-ligase [Pseudogemmobacter bohemicus]|uniref:5-formyltetrahydrofolate cyclo-ligase n=1 Tax=Pseudogemmobacter bohemicus TaxID=2250708 RepID=UPI000DD3C2EF|nr:5-formyltetrahydrofolate cyclo-ligase [Pseudogemmobacter bohemicus]
MTEILAENDLPAWRRHRRAALLAARDTLPTARRQEVALDLGRHLDQFLAGRGLLRPGIILSGYWPIKSEPDLRPWMLRLEAQGIRLALPVVETRAAPLAFRPWTKGAAMERGHWNILVPATTDHVIPDITLAPLVGWDRSGYRLGYGGGYFDRTLAALNPRPVAIGVGFQEAELATIHPQPHDIGLDAILTEAGQQV